MTLELQSSAIGRRRTIFAFTLVCSLFPASVLEAGTASVFGFGYHPGFDYRLRSELHHFEGEGTAKRSWELPELRQGVAMTTDGVFLYLAGLGGELERYDLNGNHLDTFSDLRNLAGRGASFPQLESDWAGSVYVAYGGFNSYGRTSFRLDGNGDITGTFMHEDLVYPRGIDSAENGDVYILNSAGVGVGNRLFKFESSGAYITDFPIVEALGLSDIAINEASEELYLADGVNQSIHVYDISSGEPTYRDVFVLPDGSFDVFIEPTLGTIFGSFSYSAFVEDEMGVSLRRAGFEMSRSGDLLNSYFIRRGQFVRSIVAIAVPEPLSMQLATVAASLLILAPPMNRRWCCASGYFHVAERRHRVHSRRNDQ